MPHLYEIENLSVTFDKNGTPVHALTDICLQIEKGDIFGVMGQSGAGKSSLLRALARLENKATGRILFQGTDIFQLKDKSLLSYLRSIGMIFQHFNLLSSRTVRQNIAFPLELRGEPETKKRTDELLALVKLEGKADQYPATLSGGEKQRVGIARALAANPTVLLSDEGTSALDPKATGEILALLKEINENLGVTILLITHEMEVIKKICRHVAVLDKGRLIETGRVKEVFSNPKHPLTRHFVEPELQKLPKDLFADLSKNKRLFDLSFQGERAKAPVITGLIRSIDVDVNILLGSIERVDETTLGHLVVELSGEEPVLEKALIYLQERGVFAKELSP